MTGDNTMQHLTLSQRPMLLRSINPRTENHGEEEVLRVDLDFELTCTIEDIANIGKNTGVKSVVKRWQDLLLRPEKETDLAGDRMFSEHCIDSVRFSRKFEFHTIQFEPEGLIFGARLASHIPGTD
jgi:hypothetical protein